MEGTAKGSPKTRGVQGLEERIGRLMEYEEWSNTKITQITDVVSKELWDQHWDNLKDIHTKMQQAQLHADRLRAAILRDLEEKTKHK